MSVSNYTPQYSSNSGCSTYNYSKLENRVYLVSEEHVKDVHIDNGEAYIDSLTQAPTLIEGRNISFTEEETLDERYRFSKTLQITVDGYVTHNDLSGRFYAIIESLDGTLFMVNVDFPSKVTYDYTLNYDSNETVITFSSVSNFPTLRLSSSSRLPSPTECKLYNLCGIRSLRLIESDYVIVDGNKLYMYGGNTFKDVWYLGKTLTFTETFDGDYVTNSVSFDISFDAYKSSWHYNLLEFQQNTYVARMTTSCDGREVLAGQCFGLQPSYNIQTGNGSDVISVSMSSTSKCGLVRSTSNGFVEEEDRSSNWVNVTQEGEYKGYVCLNDGMAMYVLQKEVDGRGNPTGRYRAMKGYEHLFPGLNIVGTFTDESVFYEASCLFIDPSCYLDTDIPTMIGFSRPESRTYYIESNSDWFIGMVPDYITVTPMNGVAGTRYTVTVTNTLTPVNGTTDGGFYIHYCNSGIMKNVKVSDQLGLYPKEIDIDCLPQTVCFSYDSDCPIEVISIDSRLSYQLTEGRLCVTVPRNYSVTDKVVWTIVVRDCTGNVSSAVINQDKTYEKWVNLNDFICDGNNKHVKQQRYTGTTEDSINKVTGEYKPGVVIEYGSEDCMNSITKDEFDGNYYCIDGNKFEAIEQSVSYDDGKTWQKNGTTSLGKLVEVNSDWCNLPVDYEWRLNTFKYQCEYVDYPYDCNDVSGCTFLKEADLEKVKVICIDYAFFSCQSILGLKEINFPNLERIEASNVFGNTDGVVNINMPKLKTIKGNYVFSMNATTTPSISLKNVSLPSLETIEGGGTFNRLSGLTSVDLPSLKYILSGDTMFDHTPITELNMPNLEEVVVYNGPILCVGLNNINSKMTHIEFPKLRRVGGRCGLIDNFTKIEKLYFPELEEVVFEPEKTFGGSIYSFINTSGGMRTVVFGEKFNRLDAEIYTGNLRGLYFLKTDGIVTISDENTLYNVKNDSSCYLYVPDNLVDTYRSASIYSSFKSKILPISSSPTPLSELM